MLSPSSPEFEQRLDPDWVAPDFPLDSLAEVERSELFTCFEELNNELVRLEGLDGGDQNGATFHATYFSGAGINGERLVLFMPKGRVDMEPLYYVAVNDIFMAENDRRRLRSKEYLVAPWSRKIGFDQSDLMSEHHQHQWEIPYQSSPLIRRRNDRVEVLTYKPVPRFVMIHGELLQSIEQRQQANELRGILRTLDGISLEPHTRIQFNE